MAAQQLGGQNGYVEDFGLGTIVNISEATSVTVYVHGYGAATYGGDADVDFYDGNAWRGYQALSLPIGGINAAWRNKTFGSLSMDQTDVENCRVRIRANIAASKKEVWVCAIYVVVTYTEAPPEGYSNGNPLGIPYTKVGKVMGIPIANIGKVKGV